MMPAEPEQPISEAEAASLVRRGRAHLVLDDLDVAVCCAVGTDDRARVSRCAARLSRGRVRLAVARNTLTRSADANDDFPAFGPDALRMCELAAQDAAEVLAEDAGCREAHALRIAAADVGMPWRRRAFLVAALSAFPRDTDFAQALDDAPEWRPSGGGMCATKATPPRKDVECTVCMKLFFEPVTTACGHTFCRACLVAVFDHATNGRQQCPLCRTPLHMAATAHPVTVALQAMLEAAFPAELAQRARESREDGGVLATEAARAARGSVPTTMQWMPVFPMGTVFPGAVAFYNVFEPRYRLMIRRCLEGSRRFVVTPDEDDTARSRAVGTLVRIVDSAAQPDGTIRIAVKAECRVRLLDESERDGYRIADAARFSDAKLTSPAELEAAWELATSLRAALVAAVGEDAESEIPPLTDAPSSLACDGRDLGVAQGQMEALADWALGHMRIGGPAELRLEDTPARLQAAMDGLSGRWRRHLPWAVCVVS